MNFWKNLLHCKISENAKWRNPLALLKDLQLSLANETQPKSWLGTGENESPCNYKDLRKRMQSGVRSSQSEYFKRHLDNRVGDSKQTYRFLSLIRKVRKTSRKNQHREK